MSNQLVITSGAKVRSLNGVITGTTGVLDSLPINGANGIPQLDSSGKILVSQLPNSVMEYQGTWNANTNTPTLTNGGAFNQGDVYLCNVAGTTDFGAGPISFVVGDQVIYSGSIWQKASGATGTVTSVAVTESGDALSITGSPITTSGTINIGFAGSSAQYVAGDGSLVTFPTIINEAQNLITDVYNETGATLTKGTVVYINGGHGNLPTVTKAIATGDATSAQTYGVVQADITNNNNGHVVVIGSLGDLDTQAYAAGTQLYLSSTTAGAWTSIKQYAPAHLVYVGIVVRSHPTQGIVEVRIQNGFELDELHNVSAQSPSNNDGIFYNTSTSLWEAKSIATALGFTPISLSSLSATTPLSYNSGTGAFSIQQSSGSQSGYLSSTDWNTFNNKQNALTNPVTGTGTTNTLPKFTGTSAIGNSNITDTGSLITLGSNTYVNGALGIGTAGLTGYNLRIGGTITGLSTAYGIYNSLVVQSDVTNAYYNRVVSGTQATTFTLNIIGQYIASQGTFGAGSTVTTQYGFFADSTLIGAINNYGFRGSIASGTNRWNLYMDGTASNYINGVLTIGTASPNASAKLQVDSTAQGFLPPRMTTTQKNAISTPATGLVVYDTTLNKSNYYNGTSWITLQDALTNPVTGTGVSSYIPIFNGTTTVIGSNQLRFDASNNLIIGNPSSGLAQLHVYNASAAATFLLQTNSTTDYSEIAVRNDSSTATSYFRQYSTATTGSDFGISRAGLALFFSNYATNFAIGTRNGGDLIFGTADTERARLLASNGYFGIGTSSPSYLLDVNGTGRFSGQLNITPSSGSAAIKLSRPSTSVSSDILFSTNGTDDWFMGTNALGTNLTDFYLYRYGVGNVFSLSASTGAATFSSSVTALGTTIRNPSTDGSTPLIEIRDNSNTYQIGYLNFNQSTDMMTLMNKQGYSASGISFGTNNTERMRITSGGKLLVGTTTSTGSSSSLDRIIEFSGSMYSKSSEAGYFWADRSNASNFYGWYTSSNTIYLFNGSANAASINPSTGVYTALSDINKKKNFEDSTIGLDAILGLKPTLYRMKTDSEDTEKQLGFIAQEVKEFIPQAYVENGEGENRFIGLQDRPIIAALVKAIQEQQQQIEELKAKIK